MCKAITQLTSGHAYLDNQRGEERTKDRYDNLRASSLLGSQLAHERHSLRPRRSLLLECETQKRACLQASGSMVMMTVKALIFQVQDKRSGAQN